MRRQWYKDYEMPKDVKMSNEQLGYGWFQDTVTENLFLCCRLIKDNANPDFYLNLNPYLIESARKTNAELKTYNDGKKFSYMLHLCELTNNMDSLKACKITTFDDFLHFSDTFE